MSEAALTLYKDAFNTQAQRTEARRIRTRVEDARSATTGAGGRWPFEILQNLHDAGPRADRDCLSVSFTWDGVQLIVEHDGTPFKLDEIAALLSGGSSKEWESDEQTGRFGTGFMVTHVLACDIDVRLIFEAHAKLEVANVALSRHGDEAAILANIRSSQESIKAAVPISDIEDEPTARLTYKVDRPEAVSEGLENLKKTLPFLYLTCAKLGPVSIRTPGEHLTWMADSAVTDSAFELVQRSRLVSVVGRDRQVFDSMRVLAYGTSEQSKALLLVVVNCEDQPSIRMPAPGFPRLFARFPVRDTGALPIPLVLNAPFALSQERDKVHMDDPDKAMISEAIGCLPGVAQYATAANWKNAHQLCRIDRIASTDGAHHSQSEWWNATLGDVARALSVLPLIRTSRGLVPGSIEDDSAEDYHADFVLPKFSLTDTDGPTLERLWPIVSAAGCVDPPLKDIATEWNQIAEAWQRLGVNVRCVGVTELVHDVLDGITMLDELPIREDRLLWIARLIDLVGEWAKSHSAVHSKLLERLLPDQRGVLRSADTLARDTGLDAELKDLVERIGPSVKSRLLNTGLALAAAGNGLDGFQHGLGLIVTRSMSGADLIQDAIAYLEKHAQENARVSADSLSLLVSTRELLEYLWRTLRADAMESARRLPLVSRSGSIVRITKGSVMMGPVAEWPKAAQPFAAAYPAQRVLDDLYAAADGRVSLQPALVAWRLIHPAPLIEESPADLTDKRLAAMAIDPFDTAGMSVSNVKFSQIALLSELIPKAAVDTGSAKALLGLLLCHIALADGAWREVQDVTGRRAGQNMPGKLRRALWLGDLLYRAWLPAKGEDGKTISITASAAAIAPLLESSWLSANDPAFDLLTTYFEFNPLELRIRAAAANPEARVRLEEGLATLVQLAGADTELYADLAEELVARKKNEADVDRNRTMGLAVQEAIRSYMDSRGLELLLIDHGYDYDVKLPDGDSVLDGAHYLGVGSWMMEVKATTSGDVRMTPAQVLRASQEPERYLLCVVDLRDLPEDDRKGPWTAAIVEPRAKIFPRIGFAVAPTCELVTEAVGNEVGIRNEKVLRYSVPPSVWAGGTHLKGWIDSLLDTL